ncbi:MAG: macro domain-containing protein [Candidatus Atabeyarchaeum deiterrae]
MGKSDELSIKGSVIRLVTGDITELDVDAIVNAANSYLKMGGGVAGAILRKGGRRIQDECDRIGYCPVGSAVITTGGDLRAKYVIHAVGPRNGEGEEEDKLRNATLSSLKLADKYDLKSTAFPAISTGIFGFPGDRCARVMVPTVKSYLLNERTSLKLVVFCLYDKDTSRIFKTELERSV